ncbi:MAG: ABC transporter ATP-binding protein, partial [Candidatus Omnitrophica bacterium]|nr:ABC transporter ATP-binding protein [Candidatus Omnitrophota bacterium]
MNIQAQNIHKIFKVERRRLEVLKGINISIKSGEFVSIVGPSGAGKSTLLHILGGLDAPDEGAVILQDTDVYAMHEKDRARLRNVKIGFVFQFYHLLPEFTALENVLLPMMIQKNVNRCGKYETIGIELLKKVGLQDRLNHKPNQLSGGEQQRVAIARALVNEPEVIF